MTERALRFAAEPSDEDICCAYLYLLGRLLVLRQQRLDFESEGMQWNRLKHREPGGVQWANPSLDFVYSEAWVVVDESSHVLLELPRIEGRYYTWHMLNGWGETVLNINERTFPQQPFGRYALCLAGGSAQTPPDALRIELPCRTARVLARIELGRDPQEAARLQQTMRLAAVGPVHVEPAPTVPLFPNHRLPGAEAFDHAQAVLQGAADINQGMEAVRAQLAAVAAYTASGAQACERVARVISEQAWTALREMLRHAGPNRQGWSRPAAFGHYGADYRMRTLINFVGIWGNHVGEACYFGRASLDGNATYRMHFPADALPGAKTRYFWSVVAVDQKLHRVIPNPLGRYALGLHSPLDFEADGSLVLGFGPEAPEGVPAANWLPTPRDARYNLTFRFYGPTPDVVEGSYFPPALVAHTPVAAA